MKQTGRGRIRPLDQQGTHTLPIFPPEEKRVRRNITYANNCGLCGPIRTEKKNPVSRRQPRLSEQNETLTREEISTPDGGINYTCPFALPRAMIPLFGQCVCAVAKQWQLWHQSQCLSPCKEENQVSSVCSFNFLDSGLFDRQFLLHDLFLIAFVWPMFLLTFLDYDFGILLCVSPFHLAHLSQDPATPG